MSMKRRGFLSLLGGAVAAPLIPSVSLGAATKAAYPASALHAAIYHAQTRVNFSVFALAQQLGLQLNQAEQLMSDMSRRGIVGPLQGSTQAGRWARSKVWTHPVANTAAAKNAAKARRAERDAAAKAKQQADAPTKDWADMRPFLSHLQTLCQKQGMALHPRCSALIA